MKKTIEVGSTATVTKSKDREDGLNKFAGWEVQVMSIEKDEAKVTHPFGLGDTNEPFTLPLNRLKVLGTPKAEAAIPKGKAKVDIMAAVNPGDQVKTKSDWLTVAKKAAADSTTIVCTTSAGKERRVWRDKIVELKCK